MWVWFPPSGRDSTDTDYHMQFESAQAAYRRVLDRDPNHAKVLQQLGWLFHQQSNSYASQEKAIEYLEKSVSAGKLSMDQIYCRECILTILVPFR